MADPGNIYTIPGEGYDNTQGFISDDLWTWIWGQLTPTDQMNATQDTLIRLENDQNGRSRWCTFAGIFALAEDQQRLHPARWSSDGRGGNAYVTWPLADDVNWIPIDHLDAVRRGLAPEDAGYDNWRDMIRLTDFDGRARWCTIRFFPNMLMNGDPLYEPPPVVMHPARARCPPLAAGPPPPPSPPRMVPEPVPGFGGVAPPPAPVFGGFAPPPAPIPGFGGFMPAPAPGLGGPILIPGGPGPVFGGFAPPVGPPLVGFAPPPGPGIGAFMPPGGPAPQKRQVAWHINDHEMRFVVWYLFDQATPRISLPNKTHIFNRVFAQRLWDLGHPNGIPSTLISAQATLRNGVSRPAHWNMITNLAPMDPAEIARKNALVTRINNARIALGV